MQEIWTNTSGYGATAEKLAYLDDEQNARHERIRIARALYQGKHRQTFLDEKRTQFHFPSSNVNGRKHQLYVSYNLLRRISATLTSLLLGKSPLLRAANQASLDDLVKRTDLRRVFMDAVLEGSWAGECFVEVLRWDGQVYVQNLPPDELYPIGPRQPDGQHASYRRYATATVGMQALLLVTTYEPGLISRECFKLSRSDGGDKVDLAQWPVKRGETPLPAEEPTGIDWNTIVWMGNELNEGKPTSDYDGLLELQDEVNAKQTQIARVLAKHSDPKLAAPEHTARPDGDLSNPEVYYFRTGEALPSYITWNAELAHAFADRDFAVDAMCVEAEIAQVLLGIRRGATPDAARKLRLESTATLSRVARKATHVEPFIRTTLETAGKLEAAGKRAFVAMDGSIAASPRSADMEATAELRDGLPTDELDDANVIATLTGGKPSMSVKRAVERQLGQGPAADEELAELEKNRAEATPPILLGNEP